MDGVISYANKVKNRDATRFDPMFEEAKCSLSMEGGARQLESELALKAVLARAETSFGILHPIKTTPGEQRPIAYSKSYAEFLLRDEKEWSR